MKKAVIIDYESGNLHSTAKSFEKISKDITNVGIECKIIVSSDPNELDNASHIILPGVGAFGDCMHGLKSINRMVELLTHNVINLKKPFLGICIGMQLLAKKGMEHGEHEGLGWIDATVKPIPNENNELKIPHMGWNELEIINNSQLTKNLPNKSHAYFVHSYYMDINESGVVVANTNYGQDLTAIISKDNIHGTQFHPEKSQETGFTIIRNFLDME